MTYIHAIGMKTLLKSPKKTFLTISNVSGHFRPIPATYCINKNPKNHEKSSFPPKIHIIGFTCEFETEMMIFHDFLKIDLIIINGHLKYVEVSWGSKEAISDRRSHFKPLPAKLSSIMRIIKNH